MQCPRCSLVNPPGRRLCGDCGYPFEQQTTPHLDTGQVGRSTPWSVVVLVAVNILVFSLEALWGGSVAPLTLYRMGAGLGRAGLTHEPWRVLSAAFLHIGIFHLLSNMWALLVFGPLLEAALGARQFLVLYALCAAAGGATSALFHKQILAAGASAAVWGLMTGQIALYARVRGRLGPNKVDVNMAKLVQPLIVNLLYSLSPGIDMAAHLGGGLAGVGLLLSGVIRPRSPEPGGWRFAGWVACIAMATSVALSLEHGRPWELRWVPPFVTRTVSGAPITIPVPRGLDAWPKTEPGTAGFGDLGTDPISVGCAVQRLQGPVAERSRRTFLEDIVSGNPATGSHLVDQPPHIVQLHSRPAIFWSGRDKQGTQYQSWVLVEGWWMVRLDYWLRSDAPQAWAALPTAMTDDVAILAAE